MSYRFSRRSCLVVALVLLMLAIPLTVWAVGIAGNVSGPQKVGGNVQWALTTTNTWTGGQKYICLSYTASPSPATTVACTCPLAPASCDQYVGQWTCSIPTTSVQGKTVPWQVMVANNSNCGGAANLPSSVGNASGTTSFGANTVTLNAFSARGFPVAYGYILPVAGLAVIGGVALRRARRS